MWSRLPRKPNLSVADGLLHVAAKNQIVDIQSLDMALMLLHAAQHLLFHFKLVYQLPLKNTRGYLCIKYEFLVKY